MGFRNIVVIKNCNQIIDFDQKKGTESKNFLFLLKHTGYMLQNIKSATKSLKILFGSKFLRLFF